VAWIAISAFSTTNVLAGTVDLATSPLVTGLGKVVPPNIFYILDDSGSMDSDYMPDGINGHRNDMCFRNYGYNTIYYNPNTTYEMPKNADGVDRSYVPSFTSALPDGYAASSYSNSAVDLSSTSPVYGTDTATAGPLSLGSNPISVGRRDYYVTVTDNNFSPSDGDTVVFTGLSGTVNGINLSSLNGQTLTISNVSNFYNTYRVYISSRSGNNSNTGGGSSASATYTYSYPVVTGYTADYYWAVYTSSPSSPPSDCKGDSSYTKATPATDAEKLNFAIWYSYYRTRLSMMKSASGRAFSSLDDKYRVGFTTISEKSTGATKFLDIKEFDATQKDAWYTMLYGINASGYTPLRGALSKAGRLYAGKFADSNGDHDPVQYSCQKNFTILTTDGFWNTNDETSTYGPKKVDNSTDVGDQDGASGVPKPYKDSSQAQNTLADIAYYYYNTDLRTTGSIGGPTDPTDVNSRIDVSANNVPTSNSDPVAFQHMTTFTLGLGLDGTLANPGDYSNILAGSKNWPDPISFSWQRDLRRIDDLWHAAVNGHGIDTNGGNLSAKSPDAVVSELGKALQSITAVVGSSSAAATSNLQPVNGDNTAFIAQYKTVAWTGDVVARTIDVVTGEIPTTNNWSAQAVLDSTSAASRNIYTYNSTSGTYGHRRDFTTANLATEIGAGYFNASALPQYTSLTAAQLLNATPANMIDFLRGARTYENTASFTLDTNVFRQRENVLGDVVSAAPVFVRKPPFSYLDSGYTAYLTTQSSRLPTVYVGSNDGMLHAFDGSPTGPADGGTGGTERWAYIPSMVLPNLYKLASSDYSINHRFYVDGPLAVGDAYSGSAWATILVGGLGGGGKGYYALDVTDPTAPKVLWEFGTAQDADMGYSYGNPVITKRASDDKWVVLFASGYNNTSGDKKGRLYVIDAFTGAKLSEIITTTTADEDLSGISRIANYVEDGLKNNVTQYVYAGDLSGALWKFDITGNSNAGTVQKLASTSATPGDQPITIQPELAKINGNTVVYFGTGRYLGPNDLAPSAPSSAVAQAIYAVKDTNSDLGVLTSGGANLVSQTLDATTSPRTSTNNTVDWSTNNGWYVTTPVGERFNVDPGLQLGTLVIAANIPETDYCQPTGASVLYQLSYKSGFVLATNVFQAQIVGNTQLQLGGSGGGGSVVGGKIVIESVLADGTTMNTDQASSGGAAGTAIRVNWREIE
jgi:type IV pilus assembly protein PilY1